MVHAYIMASGKKILLHTHKETLHSSDIKKNRNSHAT